MAFIYDQHFEHLLRRAGFGARPDELDVYRRMAFNEAVDSLVNYERIPDDVDTKIGQPGYVQVAAPGRLFSPNTVITDAQQRWLFRMLHSNRPLQEKMTLFWHNHFATAYTKVAGSVNTTEATRYMAAKRAEDPGGVRGQIEMLRENALGNFQTLLVEIAKDTAMLIWLDGRTNVRARPQENFGREIMELFTMGVGHYTEADVYAAARVFTGWNLTRVGGDAPYLTFFFNAGSTTRPRRRSRFRSTRTARRPSLPAAPATGCRTASTSSRRSPAARTPPPISPASCTASSCPSSATSTRSSSTACRRPTFRAATTCAR